MIVAASAILPGADTFHVARDVDVVGTVHGAARAAHAHRAEYGVETVLAHQRIAFFAAFAQTMESIVRVSIVPAARLLADVAADGPHVPELRRCDGVRGVGEHAILFANRRKFWAISDKDREGPYRQTVLVFADEVQPLDGLEVDEDPGMDRMDPILENPEEVRAACDRACPPAIPAHERNRLAQRRGGNVIESAHSHGCTFSPFRRP